MEVRKLILATVLGLAVMMFLSGLWHGLAMRDFYATHSPTLREVPLLRIIGLGYLLLSVLMAVIYLGSMVTQWPAGIISDKMDRRLVIAALSIMSEVQSPGTRAPWREPPPLRTLGLRPAWRRRSRPR